jgi:hypothetical protein
MVDKHLNAIVPEKLHKKLKVQLAKDELTYKNWLIQQIKSYTKLD